MERQKVLWRHLELMIQKVLRLAVYSNLVDLKDLLIYWVQMMVQAKERVTKKGLGFGLA